MIVSPSIRVIVRSQRMSRVPGFQPTPNASMPVALIHSAVLGRVTKIWSPDFQIDHGIESQLGCAKRDSRRQ